MRKPFARLLSGLSKTRQAIADGIRNALGRGAGLDELALETIEESLLAADVGVDTTLHLIDVLRESAGSIQEDAEAVVARVLSQEIGRILAGTRPPQTVFPSDGPLVVMVVGVNGVGKTTTIGKLAARLISEGKTVIVAAADTFRAAAMEQLSIWADRSGAEFVAGQEGGDAAAVAYDAVDAAAARSVDVLVVDTAGRLHTRTDLMRELGKIKRVLGKRLPGAPHEILLVLDANTGQNAISQARLFDEALGVTGIALAKLDGTARGGIVVAIARELSIPVRYVGVGEGLQDLEEFDAMAFAEALVEAPSDVPG